MLQHTTKLNFSFEVTDKESKFTVQNKQCNRSNGSGLVEVKLKIYRHVL